MTMYFILILVLMYSLSLHTDITFLGVTTGCAWWKYLTFNLCHTSFFHLLTNSLIFFFYWRLLKQAAVLRYLLPVLLVSAVCAALISKTDVPTIGASALIYSMIAALCVAIQYGIFRINKTGKIKYYAIIGISLVFPALISTHHVNYKMHAAAFLISLILCFILRKPLYATQK